MRVASVKKAFTKQWPKILQLLLFLNLNFTQDCDSLNIKQDTEFRLTNTTRITLILLLDLARAE